MSSGSGPFPNIEYEFLSSAAVNISGTSEVRLDSALCGDGTGFLRGLPRGLGAEDPSVGCVGFTGGMSDLVTEFPVRWYKPHRSMVAGRRVQCR